MASPKHKKLKTEGGSEGVPGPQGLPRAVPTLGDVAIEERFAPLRERLGRAAKTTPVNEFLMETPEAVENRNLLKADAGDVVLWNSFVTACRSRLADAAPKRGRVASEEEEAPGEHFVLSEVLPVPKNSRRSSLQKEEEHVIPDVPLTSRSQLGPYLKFVNREESINVLLKHAADQYSKYDRGFGEKEAQFAACSGGPGLGKTTFCRKAFSRAVDGSDQEKSIMWEGVNEEFGKIVHDCVDSGRQYRISFGSDPLMVHEAKDPGKSFALRLMRLCGAEAEWDQLPEGRFILPQVITRLTNSTKESLIVVNLDETNKLMETQSGREYLTHLLSAIRQSNKQPCGFIYLTLSGTNVRQLHDSIASETGVPPKEIPLPLLKKQHMQEVLLDLRERGAQVRSLGPQLDFVLEVLGGVPRYLEMLAFLLGLQGELFTHARYCTQLEKFGTGAPGLLEGVKGLILEQYGGTFARMLGGVPRTRLAAYSLFGWPVTRDLKIGEVSVGDLEARGCVFVTGNDPNVTLHVPLVLLLLCVADSSAKVEPPMLLKHFDVMLSPDENERASLALLALKSSALQDIVGSVHVGQLLTGKWAEHEMTFEGFGISEAETRITTENWPTALSKLQERGAFVVNCKGAPFADMIIVPKGGAFVIFLQEKQRERAKEQMLAERTVPTLKVVTVQEEHKKCNVSTPHLFVLITDEHFEDFADLESNEVVLPYDQHGAVMGPLLALLRSFNHSNKRKIAVK